MPYTVGQAEVVVVPVADNFNRDLAAKINPQAKAVGQQVSRQLQSDIADGIRRGVSTDAKAEAARTGEQSGGAFADAFKARVQAALAKLPDAKITADDSEASRKIDELRARLEELANKRVGIDISADAARAELDRIKADLDELGAKSPNIQVKVDVAKASAELAAFKAGVDNLDGRSVNVNTSQATSGVTTLWGALGLVSPAIVPIAGAAAAAGAALVSMAAAGAGAVGVLAISLASVGNAVKLLGQQQTAQSAAAAQDAQQQIARASAITAAQRQIQSAEMGLADARRAAADQQIQDAQAIQQAQYGVAQAAQRVEQAQYALAQADQQETNAVNALNTARETAARQLQSYANQAKDTALAQRQSVLDLETAQANYAKTMASGTATAQQRAQVQLDLEKAQQRVTEAQQAATNATQDNNKAQKLGVDGAPQVVQAQQALAAAQHGVAAAAQGLADAQHNQQQAQQTLANAQRKASEDQIKSQESIQRAQMGVAAAMDAMAAAQRNAAGSQSQALAQINQQVAALDPAVRAFAEYLRGTWLPIWHQVQSAATGGLLPGLQAGMEAIRPVMPIITDIVRNLASAMGGLFQQAGAALGSPFWVNWLSMIRDSAGPLLANLGSAIGNVVTGFAGILQAFMPMSLQISGGIVDITRKFADWGKGLASSPGFHQFTDYIRQEWPAIKQIVADVASTGWHLIEALGNLGGPTLSLLRTFSGVLAALPVPVVEALAVAFAGFKIFQTISGPFSAFTKTLGDFAKGADDAAGGAGRLRTMAGGVAQSLPLIGSALGLLAIPFVSVKQDQDNLTASMGKLWDTVRQGGPAAAQAAADLARFRDLALKLDSEWWRFGGINFTDAYNKAKKSVDDVMASMSPLEKAQQDVTTATAQYQTVLADPRHTAEQAAAAAGDLATKQQAVRDIQQQVATATQSAADATYNLINAQLSQANATVGAAIALDQTKQAIDNYKASTDHSTAAQDTLAQSILSAVGAAGRKAEQDAAGLPPAEAHKRVVDAQRQAFDDLTKQLGFVPPALQSLDHSLHGSAGQADLTSLAMSALGLTVIGLPQDHFIEIKAPTAAQEKALGDLGYHVQHLPNGNVIVTADTDPAARQLQALIDSYANYTVSINPQGMAITTAQRNVLYSGKATGGPISGPGTGTSDTAGLFALSAGEWVVKSSSANQYGPQAMSSVNDGTATIIPGLAGGGPVSPFNMYVSEPVSLSNRYVDAVLAEIQKMAIQNRVVAYNPTAGVEQWRSVVDSVLQALGLPQYVDTGVLSIIAHESGGNPNAINLWDSNAAAGHPSQGLMQCVTLDTRILTKRGWLRHDEVIVGDETIGYNPAIGKSEWTRITKVVHYEDAPVWRVGHRNWHADVTPNHRWFSDTETTVVVVPDACPECGYTSATKRGVATHMGRKHGIKATKRTVYRGEFIRTEDFASHHRLRLAAPAVTDGIPGLAVEEAAIVAWLIGDGHIRPTENGGWDGTIFQSKPAQVTRIRALLATVDHTESVRERGGNTLPAHTFRLRRAFVTDLIKRSRLFDDGPEAMVLAMSPEQRAAWLAAMIDAEGNIQRGKREGWSDFVRIAQVDGPIQDAIRLAVYLEGWRPTYSANSAERNGFKPCGAVGMAKPHVAPSTFGKPVVLPRQTVWCVKTALETWTAELDGQLFLTGNTIPGTFYAYAGPYGARGITDPFANIYAGVNYANHVYGLGMLAAGGRQSASGAYLGYDQGGDVPPGASLIWNGTGGNEVIAPHRTFQQVVEHMTSGASGGSSGPVNPETGTGAVTVNVYDIHGDFLGTMRGVAQQETAAGMSSIRARMTSNP